MLKIWIKIISLIYHRATEIILNFSRIMYLEFISIDIIDIVVLISVVGIQKIYVLRWWLRLEAESWWFLTSSQKFVWARTKIAQIRQNYGVMRSDVLLRVHPTNPISAHSGRPGMCLLHGVDQHQSEELSRPCVSKARHPIREEQRGTAAMSRLDPVPGEGTNTVHQSATEGNLGPAEWKRSAYHRHRRRRIHSVSGQRPGVDRGRGKEAADEGVEARHPQIEYHSLGQVLWIRSTF